MYTLTSNVSSLTPGEEVCVTITWPAGTPPPDNVVVSTDSGPMEFGLLPPSRDTGTRSRRFCFNVPADASIATVTVSGPGGNSGSLVLN